jgi:hypothetical protein
VGEKEMKLKKTTITIMAIILWSTLSTANACPDEQEDEHEWIYEIVTVV